MNYVPVKVGDLGQIIFQGRKSHTPFSNLGRKRFYNGQTTGFVGPIKLSFIVSNGGDKWTQYIT